MPRKPIVRHLHLDRPSLLALVAQLAKLLDETADYADRLPYGWDQSWLDGEDPRYDCDALDRRISRALKKAQRATAPKPKKAR